MGCAQIKNNVQIKNINSTTEIIKVNKIFIKQKLKDFNIKPGFLVQANKDDPYKLYEVINLLGAGTYGQVYKVKHKETKELRAMKVINIKEAVKNLQEESTLINEINILKNLDHINIIKIFEYFITKDELFIISELCTGGDLFSKIAKDKILSERSACHIMKQVFSAIQFCHNNNIIHRDLKPENILIVPEKNQNQELFSVKIIDFGTSDIFKKNIMLKEKIGTSYYIAPEVLNGSYNEKCDLWSCGVILYILLIGKAPFNGNDDEDIYFKIKNNSIKFDDKNWLGISHYVKDLILKLLCKDVILRYNAEQALNCEWFKVMKNLNSPFSFNINQVQEINNNLSNFLSIKNKLQQISLAYIIHNLSIKEETKELKKLFIQIDKNGDGRLTKEEFNFGLSSLNKQSKDDLLEISNLIEKIDSDKNGFIELEEFLCACINKEIILTDNNLKSAFQLFDKNKTGKITLKDLKSVFGKETDFSDSQYDNILETFEHCNSNSNKNEKEIDYLQFEKAMKAIINKK